MSDTTLRFIVCGYERGYHVCSCSSNELSSKQTGHLTAEKGIFEIPGNLQSCRLLHSQVTEREYNDLGHKSLF